MQSRVVEYKLRINKNATKSLSEKFCNLSSLYEACCTIGTDNRYFRQVVTLQKLLLTGRIDPKFKIQTYYMYIFELDFYLSFVTYFEIKIVCF